MKKKKLIIVCIFLILIAVTAIFTVETAVESYRYDMDPANGVDIMEGVEAAIIMMIGGFVVFYELDLFYTVYYFFIRPKTMAKSVIVILANVTLLLVFWVETLIDFGKRYFPMAFESSMEEGIVPIGLFFLYVILKAVGFMIGCTAKEHTNGFSVENE